MMEKHFTMDLKNMKPLARLDGKLTSYVVMNGEQQGEINLTITMNVQGNIIEK